VVVMLAGGVIAAPIAAWLARHIPGRMLGSLVGGLIVITNLHNLLGTAWASAPPAAQAAVHGAVAVVWAGCIAWSARAHRIATRSADDAEQRVSRAS
ncbi:MAG: sulfite exporter TauE/SafE family protein, partial [Jiangellaceae bacterium]